MKEKMRKEIEKKEKREVGEVEQEEKMRKKMEKKEETR